MDEATAENDELVQERMVEWGTVWKLVAVFFENDDQKTKLWLNTPNPLLGDMSPKEMIRVGRFKKLLKFIQTAVGENKK